MKILDTDTIVEVLRGRRHVIEAQSRTDEAVATTVVSVAELRYGAAKSRSALVSQVEIDNFLGSVSVLPLESPAAKIFGDTKAALERAGQRLADADLFIAAICLQHKATLVTGNRRHFDRIPALTLEDWINPA